MHLIEEYLIELSSVAGAAAVPPQAGTHHSRTYADELGNGTDRRGAPTCFLPSRRSTARGQQFSLAYGHILASYAGNATTPIERGLRVRPDLDVFANSKVVLRLP